MAKQRPFIVHHPDGGVPIKLWTTRVPEIEEGAMEQLINVARMPFIFRHVAAMPDVHKGMGATIGSVIPTIGAVMPSAVGVDIGCGMKAVRTNLTSEDIPPKIWRAVRDIIEQMVPHGRTDNGGENDIGSWRGEIPKPVQDLWEEEFEHVFEAMCHHYPKLRRTNNVGHLGTLGTGNHFIEVCLDEEHNVWIMLHSGSRGVGNRMGTLFVDVAKDLMKKFFVTSLPDPDLAYLPVGTEEFEHYMAAAAWAQRYAAANRDLMYDFVTMGMMEVLDVEIANEFEVNCHHNYVVAEEHYGQKVFVCRKGAVNADAGRHGIIPGSMGARSYIVIGKGQKDSFRSCSHGAGRAMSRSDAKRRFSVSDLERSTKGIECRKDASVIDEIPESYKDIDAVMASQEDLVSVVATLKQFICVKG